MHPIITDHLDEIRALCERYKVERLSVFGSVCTDRFTEESDVDILYRFDEERLTPLQRGEYFFELWDALHALFGREIDLVSEKSLSNPYFIEEMELTRALLYEHKNKKVPA